MAWMDKYNAVIPASHKYFQPELLKDYDIPLYTQECWENKFKQQQAEIEALKKEAALQRLSDFTQEADNEPVAWINQNIDVENGKPQLAWHKDNFAEICKPLYTHPAKTLTEQDLDKLVKDAEDGGYMDMYITGLIDGFNHARAILRKAQKK